MRTQGFWLKKGVFMTSWLVFSSGILFFLLGLYWHREAYRILEKSNKIIKEIEQLQKEDALFIVEPKRHRNYT